MASTNRTPLAEGDIELRIMRLPAWLRVENDGVVRIERTFTLPDLGAAVAFRQLLGELANGAGHHPAVLVQRENVTVAWWTMSTGALTPLDFTMAERTDRLFDAIIQDAAARQPDPQGAR